eukprot:COSAG04_NODE_1379_length_7006_cov_71.155350_3_plen_302_part_00
MPGLTLCGVRIRGGDERAARCGAPSRPSHGRAFGRPATTAHPQLHLLTDRAHLRCTDNRACQTRAEGGDKEGGGKPPDRRQPEQPEQPEQQRRRLERHCPGPDPPPPPPPPAGCQCRLVGGAWVGAGVAQGYTDGFRAERGGRGEDGQAGHAEHADHAEHAEPNSSHSRWRAGGACLPALAASPSPPGLAAPVHSVALRTARARAAGAAAVGKHGQTRAGTGAATGAAAGVGGGGSAALRRRCGVCWCSSKLCCGNGEQSWRAHPQCAAGPRGSTHTRPSGRVKWAKAEQARGTAAWAVSG